MNFYDVILAEKLQDVIYPANFFDLLFARKLYPADVWETYEGTLPATFNANGDNMRQYQIYGNAGGVGDRTVQLFDKNAIDTSNGYATNKGLYAGGSTSNVNGWNISEYIPISANQNYTFKNLYGNTASFCIYNDNKQYIWGEAYENRTELTFDSGNNASYIRFNIRAATNTNTVMFFEGTTAPATYIPYGYEIDISVSDGTSTTTTTPIYIGSDPLGEDEYVDYAEGRVIRRTVNLFNKNATLDGYEIKNNGYNRNENWCVSDFIPVESNTLYKSQNSGGAVLSFTDKSSYPTRLGGTLSTIGVTTLSETKFIKINCQISQKASCVVAKSDDLPETYIPYLQPTDPPVALPALPTVDGTTIVDYAGQSVATPEKVLFEYKKG